MFKLLTEEEKVEVKQEYSRRRSATMLMALIFVIVVEIIGLLPSYVLSNARYNEVFERTKILKTVSQNKEDKELKKRLARLNLALEVLSPDLDIDRPSKYLNEILDERGSGISVTGYSWSKKEGKVLLSLNGIALSRQDLIAFQDTINLSGHFSEVVLPISNLAQDRDISFQIDFSPI